jgi:undecaprenyl phosphate-alpha-L-ara4N flippase subunit ArnE
LIFVLVALSAEAFAQAALKRAAGGKTNLLRMLRSGWPWVAMGIALLLVDGSFWTLALQRLPVSMAFPLQSLGLVAIAVISRVFLRETISSRRWLAISMILAGTILVGA